MMRVCDVCLSVCRVHRA